MKCKLKEHEVEVSGGGLDETYSTLQFHFHWGHTEHHPGSEHKINGYRYPMEVQHCLLAFTKNNMPLFYSLCFLFYLTLSTQSMPSFVDAHCQSEERSYCGRGCKGLHGNCSSWIFHKCMSYTSNYYSKEKKVLLTSSIIEMFTFFQNFNLLVGNIILKSIGVNVRN